MNYKVQFKSYDPVANATKVSIKQDYPYRQKAFITQLNSIDIASNRFTGDRIASSDGSLTFDLVKNQLRMTNNTASISREDAGYPTQFIRYESSIENGQKHSKTIIGSNRNGSKNWNSVSFSGIVIDNNHLNGQISTTGAMHAKITQMVNDFGYKRDHIK